MYLCTYFKNDVTGKSLSEALFFASTNPQYDDRLFIELQVQYMKIAISKHAQNMLCTQIVFVFVLTFRTIYVHHIFWASLKLDVDPYIW